MILEIIVTMILGVIGIGAFFFGLYVLVKIFLVGVDLLAAFIHKAGGTK